MKDEEVFLKSHIEKAQVPVWNAHRSNKKYPDQQFTPLMYALPYPDIVNYLIQKGADLNSQTAIGNTALHIAAFTNRTQSVRILLDRGADRTIRNQGGIIAASYASIPEIRRLFTTGEDFANEYENTSIQKINLNNIEHKGNLSLPPGTENTISYDEIQNGDELIVLNGKINSPSHRFKRNGLEQWMKEKYNYDEYPTNPLTREEIRNASQLARYTAKIASNSNNTKTRRGGGHFQYQSNQTIATPQGSRQNIVQIRNGKGHKMVVETNNTGKVTHKVRKALKPNEIAKIKQNKFIPGLFKACTRKNRRTK